MGDMADWVNDLIQDVDDLPTADGYDALDDAEDGPTGAVCKFCGKWPFTWHKVDGRWRLYDDHATGEKLHKCAEYAAAQRSGIRSL